MMIGETNSDSIYSSWLLHSLAIPSVNDLYTALNTLEYKTVGTNKYVKIFHHNTSAGYFSNPAQAKFNLQTNKYSIMSLVEYLKNINDLYQFRLEYPNLSSSGYNEWKQYSNPLYSYNLTWGYTAIHIDWSGSNFNGIALSTAQSSALFDCETNHGDWWYGLGQYNAYSGGLTGPGSVVNEVRLWLKV